MRLRGHVYRIASRFPQDEGLTTWTGQPWAWDVIDLDAPIVRLDGQPTITEHGYADDQVEAMRRCCFVIYRESFCQELLDSDPIASLWSALVKVFHQS